MFSAITCSIQEGKYVLLLFKMTGLHSVLICLGVNLEGLHRLELKQMIYTELKPSTCQF